MPKTEFLQIRLTPEDRQLLRRAAASEFIQPSTWARQAILQALTEWQAEQRQQRALLEQARPDTREPIETRRVAEPRRKPPRRSR